MNLYIWNMKKLVRASVFAAGLSLMACGGSGQQVKTTDPAGTTGAGTGTAKATDPGAGKTGAGAQGQAGKTGLSEDEFKVRELEAVKAPDYLDGIDKEAQDAFRDGVKAVVSAKPDYKAGAAKFKEAIAKDKGFLEAYFNLGMTLERQGKQNDALTVYQSALDANPESASANAYIAKIYLGKARTAKLLGNTAEHDDWMVKAKDLLDRVQAKASDDPAVNNAVALYYLSQGDLETAERYVKEVLYVDPTNVTGLNTRGLINLKQGKLLIAEWIFKNKVLQQDPASTEALTNLGYTYIMLGQRPLAMRYFKDALDQDPDNMDVRMNIAAMLLEHLNYAEANEHYARVLEVEPLNVEAHEGLCDSAFGMAGGAADPKAQLKKAIACYDDFVAKRPERGELYRRIADIYQIKLQDLDNAVKYFDLFLAKGNPSPEDKTKVEGIVKVLKDIIAKGGLKAMMPPEEPPPAPEGGEGEPTPEGDAAPAPAAEPTPEGDAAPAPEASPAPAEEEAPTPAPEEAPAQDAPTES